MANEDLDNFAFTLKKPFNEIVSVLPIENSKLNYWMLSQEVTNNENTENHTFKSRVHYDDNEDVLIDCCDMEEGYDIIRTKSGKYKTTFYVPTALHAAILGRKGCTVKNIQQTTNTEIEVTKRELSKDVLIGRFKITGNNERSVASARTQISLIILTQREQMAITHFLSLRMWSEEIVKNFEIFKANVLSLPKIRGVDNEIFQKPEKLHLTLITLTLLDVQDINQAKNILLDYEKNTLRPSLENKEMVVTLQGIDIMNDDPTNVDVLYGKVIFNDSVHSRIVERLYEDLSEQFYKNSLMKKQHDKLKLHATLLNSRFRNQQTSNGEIRNSPRQSFDATPILEKFNEYYFGKISIQKLEFSIRNSFRSDGYYNAIITLSFQSE